MAASFSITGDKALDRKFGNMAPTLQKKIERKAARKAAAPVLATAKDRVPKDERQLASTLAIRALKRSRKNKGTVGVRVVTDEKKLQQIHQDRPEAGVINPHWAEFGAPGHMVFGNAVQPQQPDPFMRPAMDENHGPVESIFQTTVRGLVEEAAKEA